MKLFKIKKAIPPEEMTEEERLAHEKYLQELTAQNQKTVRKVCALLWCVAMVGWGIFLVLVVVYAVGSAKILFHSVGAAVTALLALPRVLDFFDKKKDDET